MQKSLIIMLICLALVSQQSFVDTAPMTQGITTEGSVVDKDLNVQQLENLKKSVGKLGSTLDLLKSQASIYTNVNGKEEFYSGIHEEVKENGELIAKVDQHVDATIPTPDGKSTIKIQTDVDVPSKGLHKSIVQLPLDYETFTKNANRRSPTQHIYTSSESTDSAEKMDSSSGIQYSPLDMAEYVFWTGDEKGVTLTIEEFLQEGLMSREEAISFLQEIKYNLEYLKSHYTQLGLNSQQHLKNQGVKNKPAEYSLNKIYRKPELQNNFDINQLRQEVSKKRVAESTQSLPTPNKSDETRKTLEGDYDQLLDRVRMADFLYTEYSLEEVIYQLAKVMFTQSLTQGSAEAQQALQKFTSFLESEAKQGHISKALEKKVLDVLIASLSDTLTEHPELLTAAKASLGPAASNEDGQHFIKQILNLNPGDKMSVRDLFTYKQQKKNIQKQDILKKSNLTNHGQIGFEK